MIIFTKEKRRKTNITIITKKGKINMMFTKGK